MRDRSKKNGLQLSRSQHKPAHTFSVTVKQKGSSVMVCHGCGGMIGKDCFNPQECEQITRQMAEQHQQHGHEYALLQQEYRSLIRQVERTNTDRNEIWSREKHLLDAVHRLLENIDAERALTPSKPGWRVVEMIRDILVDTIEQHQRTVRETIERDKIKSKIKED